MHAQRQRFGIQRLITVFVLVILTSCGAENATDFSSENDEAFLAACMESEVDGLLQQRVCRCVLDEAQATMAYERFVEVNDLLTTDLDAALPEDLVALVAGCVVEEADL